MRPAKTLSTRSNRADDAFAIYKGSGRINLANARFWEWFPAPETAPTSLDGQSTHRLSNGRWIQSHIRPTKRGGFVAIHNDITELKNHEEQILAPSAKPNSQTAQNQNSSPI